MTQICDFFLMKITVSKEWFFVRTSAAEHKIPVSFFHKPYPGGYYSYFKIMHMKYNNIFIITSSDNENNKFISMSFYYGWGLSILKCKTSMNLISFFTFYWKKTEDKENGRESRGGIFKWWEKAAGFQNN